LPWLAYYAFGVLPAPSLFSTKRLPATAFHLLLNPCILLHWRLPCGFAATTCPSPTPIRILLRAFPARDGAVPFIPGDGWTGLLVVAMTDGADVALGVGVCCVGRTDVVVLFCHARCFSGAAGRCCAGNRLISSDVERTLRTSWRLVGVRVGAQADSPSSWPRQDEFVSLKRFARCLYFTDAAAHRTALDGITAAFADERSCYYGLNIFFSEPFWTLTSYLCLDVCLRSTILLCGRTLVNFGRGSRLLLRTHADV